ncbi:5'/3'-nucleotidase SurE [uncultured Pseudokineococcus sp.]|uniref:5'/3'-nucleotidase SurE n=1 Tax=uncultured Pseudokineococcus sp. TaxID=1642928 RepID=UPI0026280F3B|nr:5'/3'-nucleotidase SurE [uncultured Pseudokineococcus sp.]
MPTPDAAETTEQTPADPTTTGQTTADQTPADQTPADQTTTGQRPCALVTNDDGVEGRGLALLAVAALEADFDVVVAAPSRDRSGASAAVDAELDDDRLPVVEVALPWPDLAGPGHEDPQAWCADARAVEGTDRLRVLAVSASPAFCTRVGLRGVFGRVPDVVLSGVNHGMNTGEAVLHSGTVGAALTATVFGVRALAVSAGVASTSTLEVAPTTWAGVLDAVRPSLRWVLDHEATGTLNVNVPHLEAGERLQGLRPASLAAVGVAQGSAFEAGEGYVRLTASTPPDDDRPEDPGSDTVLLAQGWATATLLGSVEQRTGVALDDLGDLAEG